jgi:hypothetical protein
MANIWRFFVALLDWRTLARIILNQNKIDVVFISNMRDEVDKRRYLGIFKPKSGHFNGPRIHIYC